MKGGWGRDSVTLPGYRKGLGLPIRTIKCKISFPANLWTRSQRYPLRAITLRIPSFYLASMMTQTSGTGSTMVCFYLQPQPFPDMPTVNHVAFCWHHKVLSPGKPQYVILARPGGIAPFPTIRPKDLGHLIYRRWDPLNHRDLHTIDCQGVRTITYFDYTSLCWRRVRRNFPGGPAGSIVAFPVEVRGAS